MPDLVEALLNIDELVLVIVRYQPIELLNEVLLSLQRLVLFHRCSSWVEPGWHSHGGLASAVMPRFSCWPAVRRRGSRLGFVILLLLLLRLTLGQLIHVVCTFWVERRLPLPMNLPLQISSCVVTAASLAIYARQLGVHAHILCQGLYCCWRFELDLQFVLDLELARLGGLIVHLAHTTLLKATSRRLSLILDKIQGWGSSGTHHPLINCLHWWLLLMERLRLFEFVIVEAFHSGLAWWLLRLIVRGS